MKEKKSIVELSAVAVVVNVKMWVKQVRVLSFGFIHILIFLFY
jgi:hypothetical protein